MWYLTLFCPRLLRLPLRSDKIRQPGKTSGQGCRCESWFPKSALLEPIVRLNIQPEVRKHCSACGQDCLVNGVVWIEARVE